MEKAKVDKYAELTAAAPPETARRAAVLAGAQGQASPGLVGLRALWANPCPRSPRPRRRARAYSRGPDLPDVFEIAETRLRDFLPAACVTSRETV